MTLLRRRSLGGATGFTNPSSLSALHTWFDFTDQDQFTYTSFDNILRNVDTITSKDTNAYASQRLSTTDSAGDFFTYNGEGCYSDAFSDNSIKSDKTSFKLLSDGSAWSMYILMKPLVAPTTTQDYIGTCTTGAQIGFNLWRRNTNRLHFFVNNASGYPINQLAANNSLPLDSYYILKFTYDGVNSFKGYRDDTEIMSQTVSLSFNTGNHTSDFKMRLWESYCKHLIICDEVLSAEDNTSLVSWLTDRKAEVITPTDINFYLIAGQSNAGGFGLDTNITAELNTTVTDGNLFAGNLISSASYWNLSHPDANVSTVYVTAHGFWQKFIFEMAQDQALAVQVYGPSGKDLESDWLPPSGGTYSNIKTLWDSHIFRELLHGLRKTPKVRGFIWMQGEADAEDAAPENADYYQANLETLIKAVADDLNSAGANTADMRVTILRIRDVYSGYDATSVAAVRAAQDYVGANFLTDFSAYASTVKSTRTVSTDTRALKADDIHYSAAGLEAIGAELDVYYSQYISE